MKSKRRKNLLISSKIVVDADNNVSGYALFTEPISSQDLTGLYIQKIGSPMFSENGRIHILSVKPFAATKENIEYALEKGWLRKLIEETIQAAA